MGVGTPKQPRKGRRGARGRLFQQGREWGWVEGSLYEADWHQGLGGQAEPHGRAGAGWGKLRHGVVAASGQRPP